MITELEGIVMSLNGGGKRNERWKGMKGVVIGRKTK